MFYSIKVPNDIAFLNKPLNIGNYYKNLGGEHLKIPDFILRQPKENILFEVYSDRDELLSMVTTLKMVIRTNENITLEHLFPLNNKDLNTINSNLCNSFIKDVTFLKPNKDGFNPMVELTDDNKTIDGTTTIQVYTTKQNVSLNFTNGGYSIYHNKCIHGNVSDLIIYDKKNELLYYERIWGGASSDLSLHCN